MKLVLSIILATVLSFFSSFGLCAQPNEDVRLSVNLISDIHIRNDIPVSSIMFEKGLKNMQNDGVNADALLIAGDLTELAREEEFNEFFDILGKNSSCDSHILALGNHDTTRAVDFSIEKAKEIFLEGYNEYFGEIENCWYSVDVKDYTFIVLADERANDAVPVFIGEEQLAFLDSELKRGTADGKPVFVVCHYPLTKVNGQSEVDLVTFDDAGSAAIKEILEKYKNVFMITGHLHTGLNGEAGEKVRGFSQIETLNGVTYVNLPAFGSLNLYGIIGFGNGYSMEVYDDRVVFTAKNFVTQKHHYFADFSVDLIL